jgi:hypothetical protein
VWLWLAGVGKGRVAGIDGGIFSLPVLSYLALQLAVVGFSGLLWFLGFFAVWRVVHLMKKQAACMKLDGMPTGMGRHLEVGSKRSDSI